jgi:hypothetical protein
MPPTEVEKLKREWTGRRVTIDSDSPQLRRFRELLGTVVTLNMNSRALVRFDGSVDIGWYDIALADLKPVAAPPAPQETAPTTPGEPPATSYSEPQRRSSEVSDVATKPKAKPQSILDLARQQGAAKSPPSPTG